MAALLHYPTAGQHTDGISVADGGETMCHDDAGATHRQSFQGSLDHTLALSVQCRGGLVQQQDLWIQRVRGEIQNVKKGR